MKFQNSLWHMKFDLSRKPWTQYGDKADENIHIDLHNEYVQSIYMT